MVRRPLDISCVVPLSLNPATVVVFLWHYPSRLAKGASGNMIAACDRATHRGPFRSCQSNWWSSHFKAQHSRSVPPSEYRSLRSGRQLGDFGDLRSHGTDEGRLLGRGFTSITMSPMVARQLYEALERHSMGTPNNSAPYLLNRRKRKIKSRAATMQRLGTLVAVAVSTWWTAAGDFSLIAQEQKTADVSTYPQLNNSVGGSCTGVVIDRTRILTAAHCLFNRRTARFLPASALHFLLGYERGACPRPCGRLQRGRRIRPKQREQYAISGRWHPRYSRLD